MFQDGQYSDTVRNVGFRLRGNTSRFSQKKSFKISFNTFVSGRRYQGVKKWNLNGQHNDPTMVREKLFYDVWNQCGLANRRVTFARLYINQSYYGLYTGLEELDKDWLTRNYSHPNGNLYKCTYPADLQYLGLNQQTYKNVASGSATGGRAYDLQTNETADDYSTFVQLVGGLQAASGTNMADQIQQVVHVENYLKALAIDVSTGNWDNYAYNKNNYFLYHHPGWQRMDFITYDTDNTFGVDWIGIDWATRLSTNWIHPSDARPLAQKLLQVPAFKYRYYQLLDSISRYVVHPDYIFSHIDSLKILIQPAAEDDIYRTLDYGYTMESFDLGFTSTVDNHTPYGIKPFLAQRVAATISQVQPFLTGIKPLNAFETEFYPQPANQLIYFQNPVNGGFEVLDYSGRKVLTQHFSTPQSSVNVSSLPPGLYWVRYCSDGQNYSGKMLICR